MQLVVLTTMTMLAFAANSLLCREALASGSIGASSFTLVRIASGAAMLSFLLLAKFRIYKIGGNWLSAATLFGYAAAFSYAYISLSAGTGALLLFGAVQVTMIVYGLWVGEHLNGHQIIGVVAAAGGLVWLMLPGIEAPPVLGATLMLGAGISWGIYSLLGRGTKEPTVATAGNFIRAIPFAVILFAVLGEAEQVSGTGLGYAAASGALASGMGYVLWYAVLPALPATTAATVQLSVPMLASFGGVLLLDEAFTLRFGLASVAVLGGISLFVMSKRSASITKAE
jgi:drug/metabolite transporter (DMT)-like permease